MTIIAHWLHDYTPSQNFDSQQLGRKEFFPLCVQLRITKRQNNSSSSTIFTIPSLLEELE
jgi:hypothetical protein